MTDQEPIYNDYNLEITRIKRVNLSDDPPTAEVVYKGLEDNLVETPCLLRQIKASKEEIIRRAEIVDGGDNEQGKLNI